MCGSGPPANGAASFDVVDLVGSSQDTSAPVLAEDCQGNADGAGNGHERTESLPLQRNKKQEEEEEGGDQMTPAEARAACIEARLKRFEK